MINVLCYVFPDGQYQVVVVARYYHSRTVTMRQLVRHLSLDNQSFVHEDGVARPDRDIELAWFNCERVIERPYSQLRGLNLDGNGFGCTGTEISKCVKLNRMAIREHLRDINFREPSEELIWRNDR